MRRNLLLGFIFMVFLVSTIVINDSLNPNAISFGEFLNVEANAVITEPFNYEGVAISTRIVVADIINYDENFSLLETVEGLTLLYSISLGNVTNGSEIIIRGISYLASRGYVEVQEVHFLDRSSSLIRSIPGLVVFVIMFFSFFTVNLRKLAIEPRRKNHA
ncbi:MAG: hypothetical protein P1Q69_17930 [Candidatus Thorarchaeota archaeon]|nr:hypothetical protein [Candidatus Thorarchaeota archaeon]